jgi:small-conductance mechanosensitive channel
MGFLVGATIVFPSISPANLLSTLGIGSIALGFAFKDILQNWLSGLLILYRRPFRRGDQIRSGEFEGTVEHIEARATLIRTYDGQRVVIPNADIYSRAVTVRTAFPIRRSDYEVGIGYGDDIEKARRVILGALEGVEGVVKDPAPDVVAWELDASSVNLKVRWWSDSKRSSVVQTRGRVIEAVKRALTEAGIDLPFPTRMVLFHDQTEATDGDRGRQREGWPAGRNPPAPRHPNEVEVELDSGHPAPHRRRDGAQEGRRSSPGTNPAREVERSRVAAEAGDRPSGEGRMGFWRRPRDEGP